MSETQSMLKDMVSDPTYGSMNRAIVNKPSAPGYEGLVSFLVVF
jgi:hypothetical protein